MSDELQTRVQRVEQVNRDLVDKVGALNNRLDTALITLTHNVNSLTDATRNLQEAQTRTLELHHSIVILQERASVVPDLQREVNRLIVETSKSELVLKGIRLLAGSVAIALLGIAIKTIFG